MRWFVRAACTYLHIILIFCYWKSCWCPYSLLPINARRLDCRMHEASKYFFFSFSRSVSFSLLFVHLSSNFCMVHVFSARNSNNRVYHINIYILGRSPIDIANELWPINFCWMCNLSLNREIVRNSSKMNCSLNIYKFDQFILAMQSHRNISKATHTNHTNEYTWAYTDLCQMYLVQNEIRRT